MRSDVSPSSFPGVVAWGPSVTAQSFARLRASWSRSSGEAARHQRSSRPLPTEPRW